MENRGRPGGKPDLQGPHELRRQCNLGYEEQRLGQWIAGQHPIDRTQINLGLTAPGHPVEEMDPKPAIEHQRLECGTLIGREVRYRNWHWTSR